MFELYPSVKHGQKYGENYMSVSAGGTKYPGKSLPTTRDDTMKSRISQHGNGAGSAGADYPQSGNANSRFSSLDGLPS